MSNHEQHDPHIPDRLERELQSAFGAYPGVPREVDRAVLGMAHTLGAKTIHRRLRGSKRWVMGAAAAVVAGGVTAFVLWPRTTVPVPSAPVAQSVPQDINGDGRVDMLDALLLASRVQQSQTGPDLNGDGKVDQRDVDAVAGMAVKLERGSL